MVKLQDIERELLNRAHELEAAVEDIETREPERLKQALYRLQEAICHVQKAQGKE